jgi:negative regulator of replication initiation
LIVASAFANAELSLEGRERLLLAVLRGLALQAAKESDPWKT